MGNNISKLIDKTFCNYTLSSSFSAQPTIKKIEIMAMPIQSFLNID